MMKFLGIKFLTGVVTASSALGLGAWNLVTSQLKKEESYKTVKDSKNEKEVSEVQEEKGESIISEPPSDTQTQEDLKTKDAEQTESEREQHTEQTSTNQSEQSVSPQTSSPEEKSKCQVFKIIDKNKRNSPIEKINWENEKSRDTKRTTGHRRFWQDVEDACNSRNGKKPYKGSVYVTYEKGKWSYSSGNQKDWGEVKG